MTEQQHAGAPRVLRVTALVAVCAGVVALAIAAFIFSYTGIHAVALQAGVNHRLAGGYPLILDVLLIVILAAMLALRGAGWPSKLLAWASLFALLAAAAGADALHAAHDRLPVRAAEITVAVLPWAIVLIAFALLMAMLRHARLRRSQASQPALPKWPPRDPPPLSTRPLVPGLPGTASPAPPDPDTTGTVRLLVPQAVAPEIAADPSPIWPVVESPVVAVTVVESALAETSQVDEFAEELEELPATELPDTPAANPAAQADFALDAEAGPHHPSSDGDSDDTEPASEPPAADSGDDQGHEADMPVFHRMWSSPAPPSD